jgi:hypothetical protein
MLEMTTKVAVARPKRGPPGVTVGPPPEVPRDAGFAARVQGTCDLPTSPSPPDEVVLRVDAMTGLQPRPRTARTGSTRTDPPARVEHVYRRCGAWDRLAAPDTRTGQVDGMTASRRRQAELITCAERLAREIPATVKTTHGAPDDRRAHEGKRVMAWLKEPPRSVCHHPLVPGSWMSPGDRGFGIAPRKRLRIADVPGAEPLEERRKAFLDAWDEVGHPFNRTSESVAKVMAECRAEDARPAAAAA